MKTYRLILLASSVPASDSVAPARSVVSSGSAVGLGAASSSTGVFNSVCYYVASVSIFAELSLGVLTSTFSLPSLASDSVSAYVSAAAASASAASLSAFSLASLAYFLSLYVGRYSIGSSLII